MTSAGRGRLVCIFLAAFLTLVIGWQVLFGGRTFVPTDFLTSREPWGPPGVTDANLKNRNHQDIAEFNTPHAVQSSRALRNGRVFLWNPGVLCGTPIYGESQLGTFYPLRLLLYRFLDPAAALDLFRLIHLFLAGLMMYACCREFGVSPKAALVGAVVWMLCGQTTVWFKYGQGLVASAWLPLMAVALNRASARRSLAWITGAGALWGVLFIGTHPQLAFLALVWAAVVGAANLRRQGLKWSAAAAGVFSVAALGVAAIQLLPFLDLLAASAKAATPDSGFVRPWRTPMMLVTLLWQRAYGSPFDRVDVTSRWCGSNWFEYQGYMGLLALALALLVWRRERLLGWTAAALLAIASLYPAWWLLKTLVPPVVIVRPHRLFLFAFVTALLAAKGTDRVLEAGPPRAYSRLCMAGCATVLLAGLGGLVVSATWVTLANPAYIALAVAAVGTVVGMLVLRSKAPAGVKVAVVLAVITADLLPSFMGYNPTYGPMPPEPEVFARLPRDERVLVTLRSDYYKLPARNYPQLYGLSTPEGYGSIQPLSYLEMGFALGGQGNNAGIYFDEGDTRALRMLNVGTVVAPDGVRKVETLPRGWLVGRVEVVPDKKERLRRVGDPGFDFTKSVILEEDVPGLTGGVEGSVERKEPDFYRVKCDRPCLLVVSETWYRGWYCTVDGEDRPILRANHALRAVALDPGEHVVAFEFSPPCLRIGAVITFISLLGLAVFAAVLAVRVRRRAASRGHGS